MVKRLFRPLGRRLQRFARVRMNNFARITNVASRAAVAPAWEEAVEEPLVWQSPVATTMDPEPVEEPEPEFEPDENFAPRRTPPDLAMILELHEERRREEGISEPPSPFRPSGTSAPAVPGAPAQRRPAAPVQRSAAPPNAPTPRPVAPPATLPRRGRVISETTPTGPEVDLPTIDEQPYDEEPPEWETDFEAADPPPDRPDLAEALISAGMMSPTPVQRDPLTPDYTPRPPRRRRARIEYETPSNPETSASDAPSVQRQAETPARPPLPPPPAIERSSPSQPPAPPVPMQRQALPPAEAVESEPVDLSPAPGTAEADLLDILGLPPDTPVMGLNPAAARPAAPPPSTSTPPTAPPTSSAAAPSVQRAESARPTPSATTPPAPASSRTPTTESTTPAAQPPAVPPANVPGSPVMRAPSTSSTPAETTPPARPTPSQPSVLPAPIQRQSQSPAQVPPSSPVDSQPGQVEAPADDIYYSDDEYVDDGDDGYDVGYQETFAADGPSVPPAIQRQSRGTPQPDAAPDRPSRSTTPPTSAPTPPTSIQRQKSIPDARLAQPTGRSSQPADVPPPAGDNTQSPPPAQPYQYTQNVVQREPVDDFDEFGDTQPIETLRDIEPPTAPGYHIDAPPISHNAPSGQVSRVGSINNQPTTKLGTSGPAAPDGKLGDLTSPATSTSSSTPPPMGGKLGGKLGNDVVPGKISSESPPPSPDAPAEGQPEENPNAPLPQEALDLLETFGFDTTPFDESNPNGGTTTTTSSESSPNSTGGGSESGGDGGGEGGEGGDDQTSSEDAAQDGGVNVDKLARDVFSVLRDRLRIENERRSSR